MESLRQKQIEAIQKARWADIEKYGDRIGQSPRKGWKGPSDASIARMKSMIDEHRRLTAKGKGRTSKRQTRRRRR